MKNLIILFIQIITAISYGQASGNGDFFIRLKFDENIPVDEIELFRTDSSTNIIKSISYKSDLNNNAIEISGNHGFIVSSKLPIFIFSRKTYNSNFEDSKTTNREEIHYLYYLNIEIESINTLDENFTQELKFSDKKPFINIKYINNNDNIKYEVLNESLHLFEYPRNTKLNKLIKVNKINSF